jgi:hypothetical protein
MYIPRQEKFNQVVPQVYGREVDYIEPGQNPVSAIELMVLRRYGPTDPNVAVKVLKNAADLAWGNNDPDQVIERIPNRLERFTTKYLVDLIFDIYENLSVDVSDYTENIGVAFSIQSRTLGKSPRLYINHGNLSMSAFEYVRGENWHDYFVELFKETNREGVFGFDGFVDVKIGKHPNLYMNTQEFEKFLRKVQKPEKIEKDTEIYRIALTEILPNIGRLEDSSRIQTHLFMIRILTAWFNSSNKSQHQ